MLSAKNLQDIAFHQLETAQKADSDAQVLKAISSGLSQSQTSVSQP